MLEHYVWPIWLGKHRWTCFHARWRTATLCPAHTCLVGSEVSGKLAGTRTSRMACKKSRSHALWLFPVGLGKGGVLGKTAHNGTIGGPDSERYHQRPTWLPEEDCGFHPRSFEEAGGCRRCLHWISSYASIFPLKKVHVEIIFVTFALKIKKLWPFLNAYLLPTHPVDNKGNRLAFNIISIVSVIWYASIRSLTCLSEWLHWIKYSETYP